MAGGNAPSLPSAGKNTLRGNALAALRAPRHVRTVPLPLRLTFWISLLAATAAGVAHGATYFGRAPYQVLALLPALFVVWPLVLWQWRRVPRRNLRSQVFGDVPRWMKWAIAALLLYAFANFFVGRGLNDGGTPQESTKGNFALVRGTEVVRRLSESEYRAAQAVQIRVVSGFLLSSFALAVLLAEACWIKNGPAMAEADVEDGV